MSCMRRAGAVSPVRVICLAVLAIAVASVAGCGSNKPAWLSLDPDDWAIRRQVDEPLMIDVQGPISLDIDNFAGNVVIQADPELTAGEVVIVREGLHGFGRSKEAEASLSEITASVELGAADTSRGELGQTLRIRTGSTGAEPHFQRAHLYIKAPAIDGLTVRTSDGDVTARHVEGMVDIESSNGTVSVRTNLAMTRPVTIINRDGDIIYRSNPETMGLFDAQTVNGEARADFRYGSVRVEPVTRDNLLVARLNDGQNRMTFRTTNGDIDIGVFAENERSIILGSDRKPPKEDDPLTAPDGTDS